ncbi:hypothetical protein E8E13_004506 [Curvularia kusanoi]|uniref:Uncharacterized protein n=1 Tax=Curvularia kusanoi TaxID=90978 RepID=A0A9P4T8Z1_CURKU|nr:hypothetical protein E8E13_004506 [Curvularia kusanoi]
MFNSSMLLRRFVLLLALLMTVLAAPATNKCQLGANKCDETNTSIMLCGFHGWQMVEMCPKVGGCHVGPAGNAFCAKEVECLPGQSQCDSANYASKVCNHRGFWEIDRKCSKPGCCELRDGKAACKAECGPGLEPPMVGSSAKRDLYQNGHRGNDI